MVTQVYLAVSGFPDWGFEANQKALNLTPKLAEDLNTELLATFYGIDQRLDLGGTQKTRRCIEIKSFVDQLHVSLQKDVKNPQAHQRLVAEIEKTLVVLRRKAEFFPGDFNTLPHFNELALTEINSSLRMKWKGLHKHQRTTALQSCIKDFESICKTLRKGEKKEFDAWCENLKIKSCEFAPMLSFDLTHYKFSKDTVGPKFTIIEPDNIRNEAWIFWEEQYYEVPIASINAVYKLSNSLYTVLKGNEFSLSSIPLLPHPALPAEYWGLKEQAWKSDELARSYQIKYQEILSSLTQIFSKECRVLRSFRLSEPPLIMELFGGDGELAQLILEKFPTSTYHLSDANQKSLKSARKRLKNFGIRVSFHQYNALTVDLKQHTQRRLPDIVIISGGLTLRVMENGEEAEYVLKKLYSSMPIKGFLILNGHQPLHNSRAIFEEYFLCLNSSMPRGFTEQLFILQKRQLDSKDLIVRDGKTLNFFHFMQRTASQERCTILQEKIKDLPDNLGLDLSTTNVAPNELRIILQHFKRSPRINLSGVQLSKQHLDVLKNIHKCHLNLSMTSVTRSDLVQFSQTPNSINLKYCNNLSVKDQVEISTSVALRSNPQDPDLRFLSTLPYRESATIDHAMSAVVRHMDQYPKMKLTFQDYLPGNEVLLQMFLNYGIQRFRFNVELADLVLTAGNGRQIDFIHAFVIKTFGEKNGKPNSVLDFSLIDLKNTETVKLISQYIIHLSRQVPLELRKSITSVKGFVPQSLGTLLKQHFPNIKI